MSHHSVTSIHLLQCCVSMSSCHSDMLILNYVGHLTLRKMEHFKIELSSELLGVAGD